MTAKRVLGGLLTVLCAALGVLHWMDLAGNTDAATGFLIQGSVLIRYGLLAAPLALIFALGLAVPAGRTYALPGGFTVPGFCGLLFSGIIGVSLFFLRRGSWALLAAALLFVLSSFWFSAQTVRPGRTGPWVGLAAVAGWMVVCAALFGKTASLYHLTLMLELLSSLFILLFVAGLLRGIYAPQGRWTSRALFMRGFCAFYLGTCLALPLEVWQWMHGIQPQFMPGKAVAAALLGISGLLCALRCLCTAGTLVADAPDPEDIFDEAMQRLAADEAAPEMENTPQRMQSAASLLYGLDTPAAADAPYDDAPDIAQDAPPDVLPYAAAEAAPDLIDAAPDAADEVVTDVLRDAPANAQPDMVSSAIAEAMVDAILDGTADVVPDDMSSVTDALQQTGATAETAVSKESLDDIIDANTADDVLWALFGAQPDAAAAAPAAPSPHAARPVAAPPAPAAAYNDPASAAPSAMTPLDALLRDLKADDAFAQDDLADVLDGIAPSAAAPAADAGDTGDTGQRWVFRRGG